MAKNPLFHGRTKHIDVQHHFIRNLVAEGRVTMKFCGTNEQVAGILMIYHGFYPLSAMVYECFNIYLLLYRVYLEYLQVQVRAGEKWWFWSILRCRTVQTHHMFSYGWKPSQGAIELIFWHKIYLWVIFTMPPVWGQSASYIRSYVRFTEEWHVCLARGNCQGDEGMSIDDRLLASINGDLRRQAEPISWPI